MDGSVGKKCLAIYVLDVLEQRDKGGREVGGRRGERKEGQGRKKEGAMIT